VTDYVRKAGELANNPGGRNELQGTERVLCLDAASGKENWKHEYDCPYAISYAAGPRATPTVHAGKVYTLGAEGNLFCFDAARGTVLWSKELKKEYKTEAPIWGFCGHPLVDGKKLICLVGGAGSVAVAFDKDSGQELWRSLSNPDAGYCPPTIITAGGKRQLLIWHPQALNSLNPETGEVYWTEPQEPQYGMSIAAPRQAGDFLYASGIGKCAALFKLDRDKPGVEVVWDGSPTTAVFCANSTPFIDGGTIYGNDCEVGNLRAVKLERGERLWETFQPTTGGERRASHGTAFLTKNGDRYFLFSETGDLVIARLTPEKYEELSRAHLLEPTAECFGRNVVWSHPAYANKCVFVRNDKEIICASLAK
jgi:outer membrane protein assembly factor BamB